jgi:hypothetical protein
LKEIKSIFGVLLLLVGGFVLYLVLPAYWSNYQVDSMITEQAIYFTSFPKPEDEMRAVIAQKAQSYNVPLAPEQIVIDRTRSDLTITVHYNVHIELPLYPFDLRFENSSSNHDVMK